MRMVRQLMLVAATVLSLNFVAMVAVAAVVAQRAQLDREKIAAVKEVLFPPPDSTDSAATEEPEPPPATPMEELLSLLDAEANKAADARVADVTRAVDRRAADLDRRARELADRAAQVAEAAGELGRERDAFEAEVAVWRTEVDAAVARAADEGFRASLELYETLPAKRSKALLIGLDDATMLAYLRAMDTTTAAKILREFKTDAEAERARSVLELMRAGRQAAADAAAAGVN